mgnify:FL=1
MTRVRVFEAVGTALGMGLVGGAFALSVGVLPAHADSGQTGSAASVHDSSEPAAKPPRNNKRPAASTQNRVGRASAPAATVALKPAAPDKPTVSDKPKTPTASPKVAVVAATSPKPPAAQTGSRTTSLAPEVAQLKTAAATTASASAAAATKVAATTTAHAPTLLNAIGSLVFNTLGVVMQWFAGKPILPKGSTVTAKVTTLTMPDTGQKVNADWYFPAEVSSSTRLIYFQHGFMAVNSMYSYTLAALAEKTNSIIVAPTLSSNAFDTKAQWLGGSADQKAVADLFVGDRAALTASARSAGFQGTLPTDFVLAGHSLGGGLVTAAAGYTVDNGAAANLKGVLLMDAVDVNNVVPTALAKLTGANSVPVYDISSEPYAWNRNGIVAQELQAARPGAFNGVMLQGGKHIDGLQGGNPILQFAEYLVAGFSTPQNVAAEKTLAIGWINDMFAGTREGIYGSPEQSIAIATGAGTATAVVLPLPSLPGQATLLDSIANVILSTVLQLAVYEPYAGGAVAV